MFKLTITEGLAELKTIASRVQKKRESIMRYFARDSRLRDPLEKEGGTQDFVRRERQAIRDLEERFVEIRGAIQQSNLTTFLTLEGTTRTVAGWLNWKRDVSQHAKEFLGQMATNLTGLRQQALKQGLQISEKDSGQPGEIVVAVSEIQLAEEVEKMERLLGDLDGKLSLLNATTTMQFP